MRAIHTGKEFQARQICQSLRFDTKYWYTFVYTRAPLEISRGADLCRFSAFKLCGTEGLGFTFVAFLHSYRAIKLYKCRISYKLLHL